MVSSCKQWMNITFFFINGFLRPYGARKKDICRKKNPFLSRKKISSMCLALPIQKRIPGVDWTLGYHGRAVHPRGVLLNHPVPVNGEGFIRQTVLYHYFNLKKIIIYIHLKIKNEWFNYHYNAFFQRYSVSPIKTNVHVF